MNEICANNCFSGSNNYHQFGVIFCYNSINTKNFCNLLSVTNCNNINNAYCCFSLTSGNISLTNYNSSNNNNIDRSGIYIDTPSKLVSNFCTIINNFVSSENNIHLGGLSSFSISY